MIQHWDKLQLEVEELSQKHAKQAQQSFFQDGFE